MEHQTAAILMADLGDLFHDWIDGDDPPIYDTVSLSVSSTKQVMQVEFESGKRFLYTIEEIT